MCSSMNHLWRTFCSMPIYVVSCRTYCSLRTLPGAHNKARESYAARRQKRLGASCMETLHIMWYQQMPKFPDEPGHSVFAALSLSGVPSVPATFQDAIDSGHVRVSTPANLAHPGF